MKKWAGRAGIALGILALALILLVGALFVWLGTESARRSVLGLVEEALAGQGLYLTVERTAGRLPFSLELDGVSLADAGGKWLGLASARLELNPWRLFGLAADVEKLHLEGLVLSRLPVLPQGGAGDAPAEKRRRGVSLPLDVHLDDFLLDALTVEPELLAALWPEKAAELARLGQARLAAKGSAALRHGLILEPGHILVKLQASLSWGESAAGLELYTGPGDGLADKLRLSFTLREGAGGLAALFSSLERLPPYSVKIFSDSSLGDMALEFSLEAERLAKLSGSLALRALGGGPWRQSNLERLTGPNWELSASLKAAPGPLLSEPGSPLGQMPELALELIGPEVDLNFTARSKVRDSGAQIEIDSLHLENALVLAGVERAGLDFPAGGKPVFKGDILAQVKDERFFSLVGAYSDGAPMFGKSLLRLNGRAALAGPEGKPSVEFSLKGPLSTESRHYLFSGPDIGPLRAELEAAGRFDGHLALDVLRLDLLGLRIDGRAGLDFAPLVISLEVDLDAAPRSDWNDILRHLAGGIPELGFKAALTAGLDLRPESAARELTARVRLAASDYVSGGVEKLFGDYVALEADFSGPLLSPYNMTLYGLSSGFAPQEAKACAKDELVPGPEAVRALGWLELSLSDAEPLRLMPRWSRKQQIDMLTLNGEVDACLGDVGPLLPADSGLSGPLRASASMRAVIGDDADTLMDFRASLSSYGERPLQSGLGEMSLSATTNADLTMRGGVLMLGRTALDADSAKGGPLRLNTGWELAWPDGSDFKMAVSGLQAAFAEVNLQGEAAAFLPPGESKRPPRLLGQLKVGFENWKALNTILARLELGIPPLSGARMDLDINMGTERGLQMAELRFALPRFQMLLEPGGNAALLPGPGEAQPPLGTPGMLLLNGIQGQVDVNDLWGKRLVTAHLKTDSGSADVETWESFAVYLDLAGNVGRLNLALRGDGEALNQARAVDESAPPFTPELVERYLAGNYNGGLTAPKGENGLGKLEMASLAGVFRVEPPAFALQQAAMFSPELGSGFYLKSPVIINLEKGLVIDKLDVAVLPDGHIRGSAHFSAEESRADTDIKNLPLGLVRKLTGLPLPDGEFSLEGDVRSQNGLISGQSEVLAVLRPANASAAAAPLTLRLSNRYGQGSGAYRATGPGQVRFSGSGSLAASGAAKGQGMQLAYDLPIRVDERGFLVFDAKSPLEASASWNGDIGPAWRLLPLADRRLDGMARFAVRLGGSLSRLSYQAEAFLAGGRYEDSVLGVMLADINLEARAGEEGARLTLAGGDGRGGSLALDAKVSGDGAFSTGFGGGAMSAVPELTARGQINHLAPLHRDDVSVMISGIVDAAGPLTAPLVRGDFVLEQGNVNLMASMGGGVTTLPVEERSEFAETPEKNGGPHLEITLDAPGRFFVRGAGLDSEWRGRATVNGQASAPEFSAEISPVRGYFEMLSRPFAISKGQISVWGGVDYLDSDLDLLLTFTSASLTAEINVGGSLRRPSLTLNSRPALPQDQILSQVIFGKDITQLTALEALQVANGLRQLMSFGQGGVDIMGEMRELLGVDTLRIGSTATGTHAGSISGSPDASAFGVGKGNAEAQANSPTLEAGKYINDSIYIGVEQGAVENSTRVRMEIELRPNLTLEGSSGGQSSQIGLGWKRDY